MADRPAEKSVAHGGCTLDLADIILRTVAV
jgi:hypothetical protein